MIIYGGGFTHFFCSLIFPQPSFFLFAGYTYSFQQYIKSKQRWSPSHFCSNQRGNISLKTSTRLRSFLGAIGKPAFEQISVLGGFPGGSDGKEPTCSAGDSVLIPGSGRSPGERNGNPLQYSCLENPTDREPWWATVHRVAKSQTQRLGSSNNNREELGSRHCLKKKLMTELLEREQAYLEGSEVLTSRGLNQSVAVTRIE